MIHLLVISNKNLRSPVVENVSDLSDVKLVCQNDPAAARPLVETGIFDLVLVVGASARESITLSAALPALPGASRLVLGAPAWTADEQSEAYETGVSATLSSPVNLDLLVTMVSSGATPASKRGTSLAALGEPELLLGPTAAPTASPNAESLELVRDFSRLLGYSLDPNQFAQQFVQRLREIISANRIAVFFEPAPYTLERKESHLLRCVASVGIPREVLRCLELSRRSGLGRHITQNGQVLRRARETLAFEGEADPRIDREFEILGCQVALPINDRENTIGLAVIGGRLTGGRFNDDELKLVYHLLEELGVAVRNSWLHHAIASNERKLNQILGALDSGCLVLEADLRVRHVNRAFLNFIRPRDAAPDIPVELSELPPEVGATLQAAVTEGKLKDPILVPSPSYPARTYRVRVVSLSETQSHLPQAVMVIAEDFTQVLAAQKAEIEASNLRLTTLIAKRFAHEIRNSLVPLNTHEQLFETEYDQADFRASLKSALSRETSRIQRFTDQMLLLSHPITEHFETVNLADVLVRSFQRAEQAFGKTGSLNLDQALHGYDVQIQQRSMMHALEEIFLNSLQSSKTGTVTVSLTRSARLNNASQIELHFKDDGKGFDREQADRATEAFFTTRNTGVGLGLTVAQRVLETHGGTLRIFAREVNPESADLIVQLPLR